MGRIWNEISNKLPLSMIIDTLKLGIECASHEIYLIEIKDIRSEDPWCYVMEGVVKKTVVNQGARGAAAGTKMTVSIKSRQRNATAARCHPSRGANAWRGQMKCDLIRHSLIPRSFTTYAVTKKNKEPHLIRTAKSYVLFTMDGETTNPTNLTFKTSDNLFNSEHF